MMTGQIVKGIGGFYYVARGKEVFTLKAPGRFRKEGIKPVVGDMVEFESDGGYILEIMPRKNIFYRPAVSNVTQGFIVVTGAHPRIDFLLTDKLIIQCEMAGIDVAVLVNKQDLADEKEEEEIRKQYSAYKVICCSATEGSGIDEIKELIKGNTSFFAGQSGVGKSSIINAVTEKDSFETGDISQKLKRGRHTTRHVELIYLPELDGGILDTPGFSFYDFKDCADIQNYYREFEPYRNECKFNMCTHVNEPGCKVREHVGNEINKDRYERYLLIQKEQNELRRKKYD